MRDWAPTETPRAALTAARRRLNASLSEKEFQSSVVDLAEAMGWRSWHDRDARRNAAGLPDWILLRPPRLLFIELKSETGRLRPEQRAWIDELARCPGVEVHVWKPGDWPEIEEALQ